MWLTIRSIRSAGLFGMRPPARLSLPAWICSRCTKKSRTWQSVGCTVTSTRSNTAKPTGLVSIAASAARAEASVPRFSSMKRRSVPAPAARRRNTSRSYSDV